MQSSEKMIFCDYCDHTGIIADPAELKDGLDPLVICPKCVKNYCNCKGVDPYFYSDERGVHECSCRPVRMRIDRIHALYNQAGLDKKYKWRFINEFNCRTDNDNEAKKYAYDIILKFPDVKKGLFLWGNPGTGKTMLSAIILTELIKRKAINAKYIKISRHFFNRIRETFSESSSTYGQGYRIEQELAETELLVIDDFGIQKDTAWEQETLYNLIDARYEAERLTIITSNINPEKTLKELSEGRILSRLKEMCHILELSGEDRRK